MNPKEKLFLNTINDLQEKVENNSEYSTLKSSGLLRQLIIDHNSLLNQVNKDYKLKINFIVQKRFSLNNKPKRLPDGTIERPLYGMILILPSENSNHIELITLKDFLKYELLFNGEDAFTVLDIIRICAHKYGGVHIEDVKKDSDLPLDDLNNHFIYNDSSSILQSLQSIAKITLTALQPLVREIKNKVH